MKKYFTIASITLKEYFTYRLNFILWRLRMFFSLMITFFLWNSVFDVNSNFGVYDKSSLLSYILYANLISNFVLGTRTAEIASDINDGSIINYLLKPVSFFKFILARDIVDKAINAFFAIFEILILVLVFKVSLVIPHNFLMVFLFFVVGTLLSFYINLALSFIGFWTTEVWAPRFVFMVLVFFISGSYFPLDLLPTPIYLLLLLSPFPYLFYFPTKLMLGQVDNFMYLGIIMAFFWVILMNTFSHWLWKKGNQTFSFWGR